MGAPKKIDRYRDELTDEARATEDEASRARLAKYQAMADGPARDAALEAETDWREDVGLPAIS